MTKKQKTPKTLTVSAKLYFDAISKMEIYKETLRAGLQFAIENDYPKEDIDDFQDQFHVVEAIQSMFEAASGMTGEQSTKH